MHKCAIDDMMIYYSQRRRVWKEEIVQQEMRDIRKRQLGVNIIKYIIYMNKNVRKKPTILYNKCTLIKTKKILTNCNIIRDLDKIKIGFFFQMWVCVHTCISTCVPMHVHVLLHESWIPRSHLPELSLLFVQLSGFPNIIPNIIISWKIFDIFLNISENRSLGLLFLYENLDTMTEIFSPKLVIIFWEFY